MAELCPCRRGVGTTGQGIPITGFSAKTTSSVAGGIAYQLHLSNVGWTSGKTNGEQLSSTAESNSVEAIKISLSGDLATYFDVWYRVHVDNVGWLGWTKNGAVAGSTGYGTHVQAVQVRLTRKGANAPGSTVSPCLLGQPSAFANPMQKKIVDLARQVPSPGPGLCSSGLQISTSVPDLGTSIQMPAITTGIIVNSPIILS